MASDLSGKLDEIFSKLLHADADASNEDTEELLNETLGAPPITEDEEDDEEEAGAAKSAPKSAPSDDSTADTPQVRRSQAEVRKLKQEVAALNKQKLVIAREEAEDIERRDRLVFLRDGNTAGPGGFALPAPPALLENPASNRYYGSTTPPEEHSNLLPPSVFHRDLPDHLLCYHAHTGSRCVRLRSRR
jgi:hypothetical protein